MRQRNKCHNRNDRKLGKRNSMSMRAADGCQTENVETQKLFAAKHFLRAWHHKGRLKLTDVGWFAGKCRELQTQADFTAYTKVSKPDLTRKLQAFITSIRGTWHFQFVFLYLITLVIFLTNVKLAELLITQLSFGPRVLLDLFPHSFQLPQYLAVRHQVAHLHTV